VAAGIALAVPRPPPADRDSSLTTRLEPVDIGALEQAGLDQTRTVRQDSKVPAARLRP
jgi:hypothetical protein